MKKSQDIQQRAEKLMEECRQILRELHIPVSDRIEGIVINPRIRQRFGSCRKIKKGLQTVYRIELSSRLMEAGEDEIRTVLFHELLHTCPGCMNHGQRWKKYAEQLNEIFGLEIKRTARYEDLGLEAPESRETVKYRIICTCCGQELTRKRRCSLVENIDRYRCGKCGGVLKIL